MFPLNHYNHCTSYFYKSASRKTEYVKKNFLALFLSTFAFGSLYVIDEKSFNKALNDYADGISKTAYAISGDLGDNAEAAYNLAIC